MIKLLIVGQDPSKMNGWGVMTRSLVSHFPKYNFDITLLSTSNNVIDLFNRSKLLSMALDNPITRLIDYWKMSSVLRNFDAVLIITEPLVKLISAAAEKASVPVFIYNAGTYTNLTCEHPAGLRAMSLVAEHFPMSSYTARQISSYLPNAQTTVVGGGVEKEIFFSEEADEKKPGQIIFVGNLKERKGFWVLSEALKLLSPEKQRQIHLVIVGGSDLEARPSISVPVKNVCVRNPSDEELRKLYAESVVNVLPSISGRFNYEGFGIVHSEAIACGTLTIGSFDCGNEDAIKPGNGFLIKQRDYHGLSALLDEILFNGDQLRPTGPPVDSWCDVSERMAIRIREYVSSSR